MNIPAKQIHTQTFDGGMNSDIADELMPSNTARYKLNCRAASTSGGQVGVVSNLEGNTLIETPLPDGFNKVIGSKADEEANKAYFFVFNDQGYNCVLVYDGISNTVQTIIRSRSDSNDIDILRFSEENLILHIDVVQNNLLYWVDGKENARKVNIRKCMDKSAAGYGANIQEEFISAYRRAPQYAPTSSYFNDTTKQFNYLYGKLYKFSYRYIYEDGEVSNWSDFSQVPLPVGEKYNGDEAISYNNNGIAVVVQTGPRIVTKIELAVKINNADFVSFATLNKAMLFIVDNSTYTYNFYNDGLYGVVDPEKIIRPYSYLPVAPKCQAFVQNAMVYVNFNEGFPVVGINATADVIYNDLFIEDDIENKLNEPNFIVNHTGGDYVDGGTWIGSSGSYRYSTFDLTIGFDVKKGNVFTIRNYVLSNAFEFSYTAKAYDDAVSVANAIRALIQSTGHMQDDTANSIDGSGNVTFSFRYNGSEHDPYPAISTNVTPVNYQVLKNNGFSIKSEKSGSSVKYGIVYEDQDGRKSLTYTTDLLIVKSKFISETNGPKQITHQISIKNRPPEWAYRWQLVRTTDLTYDTFVQLIIQKVINVTTTADGQYLDLVVGSLFTYQKMHPNTVITYQFTKGDRLRFIKQKTEDGTGEFYFPFHQTEVLSYLPTYTELIRENVICNNTDQVTVDGVASADNIGRFIIIDGVEREIVGAAADKYTLNRKIQINETLPEYTLVDRRGILRIRKPSNFVVEDFAMVEVYRPAVNSDIGAKRFYEFGKKFDVLNPGTATRAHKGNAQDQDGTNDTTIVSTPAIVTVGEGQSYYRNRELPITNNVPGTQALIDVIEDPNFSDFYESDLSDNGKENFEDDGSGVRHLGSRFRFSNNYIEDTKINGLNDFDNSDREDYNDPHGDVQIVRYRDNRLYVWKSLKTGWIPILGTIIQDQSGQSVLGASSKLLNPIQYFQWEGGIGNNPESLAQNADWFYYASPNSGVFIRLGGSGALPISQMYGLDKDAREILTAANKYKARIYGGFDRKNHEYIAALERHKEYVYFSGFTSLGWSAFDDRLPNDTVFEIVTPPAHGTAVFQPGSPFLVDYTPNADYSGQDFFTYRYALPGGGFSPTKKVCLTVNGVVWLAGDFTCELGVSSNITGFGAPSYMEKNNGKIYVTNYYSGDIDVIDPVLNTISASIYSGYNFPTDGRSLRNIIQSQVDANRMITVSSGAGVNSILIKINTTTNTVDSTFDVGFDRVGALTKLSTTPYFGLVAFNGTSIKFYDYATMTHQAGMEIPMGTTDTWLLGFNNTGTKAYVFGINGQVRVYDIATKALLTSFTMTDDPTPDFGGSVFSNVMDPLGNRLMVTNNSDNYLYVINTDTDTFTRVEITGTPVISRYIPDLNQIYVSNRNGEYFALNPDNLGTENQASLEQGPIVLADFIYSNGKTFISYIGDPLGGSPGDKVFVIDGTVKTGKKIIVNIKQYVLGAFTGQIADNLPTNPSIGLPYFAPEINSPDCQN